MPYFPRRFCVFIPLLCLPLVGCGSTSSGLTGAPLSASLPASSPAFDSEQSKVLVPTEGGTIVLPSTSRLAGSITFAPGAQEDTLLTLQVSDQPPPGTAPQANSSASVQTVGVYFLTLSSSRPLDMSLITALKLSERPFSSKQEAISARVDDPLPDGAQFYRAELNEIRDDSLPFVQEIPGNFDLATQSAEFGQIQPVLLEPGRTFLVQAKATTVETLPVTVVNNSGIEPAYFTVLGRNPNPLSGNDPLNYRVAANGEMLALRKEDRNFDIQPNNLGGFNGYTDLYNIPIKGSQQLKLPQMAAGRVYLSLGNKLRIRLEDRVAPPPQPPPTEGTIPLVDLATPLNLAQPDGWGNPGDPNYKTLWDWVEFDYKVNVDTKLPGMGINKTEVDMMSLGIQIELQGPTIGKKTVGTLDNNRKTIFDTLLSDNFFKSLVIAGPAQGQQETGQKFDLPADIPVRAISPKKAIDNVLRNIAPGQVQTFDTTYFDQYLTDVWAKYRSENLIAYTSAFGTYSGRVNASDNMVFTRVDDNNQPLPGFQKIHVRKPQTAEAFEPTELITSGGVRYEPTPGAPTLPVPPPPPNVRAPGPGDDPALFTPYAASEIVSALSAAMNRTTLLFEPLITRDYRLHPHDKRNFYRKNNPSDRINVYAKTIHDNSILTTDAPGPPDSNGGGAAYAFGFDDNSNQSSFLSENTSPTKLVITITKLKP
jgi:hypothetical protein